MMSTRKFITRSALRGHLLELEGLPTINWENQVFTPPTQDGEPMPYIRETLMPADEFLSANNERTGTGIYRLDYFLPMGGSTATAENTCDDIKEHFRPAQTLGNVKIERSWVGQGDDNDPPWIMIPISIDYRTHSQNLQPA